jgi:putative acetyltransferase
MTRLEETLDRIVIRAADNRDSQPVLALVGRVLTEFGLETDVKGIDADLLDIEASYLQTGGSFEVLEDSDGLLLGTIGIFPLSNAVCELRKMYLVPELRGFGFGKYLLERAVSAARDLGFKRMVLETSSKLRAANRLYTNFGFRPIVHDHLSARADLSYAFDL